MEGSTIMRSNNMLLLFTAIGTILCLLHAIGHDYDPIYLLFYALSIPAWIYPIFTYTNVDPILLYTLTILSWSLIGYFIDLFSERNKAKH
jgi:hypothetical protein